MNIPVESTPCVSTTPSKLLQVLTLGAQIKLGRPNFNLICKLGRPNLKLDRPNLFRSAYLILLGRPNNFF